MAEDADDQSWPWWRDDDGADQPAGHYPRPYQGPQAYPPGQSGSSPGSGYGQYGYGQFGYGPAPRRRRGRGLAVVAGVAGLLAAAVAGGFVSHELTAADRPASASNAPASPPAAGGNGSAPGTGSGSGSGSGAGNGYPSYGGSGGSTPSGSNPAGSANGPSDTAAIAARVDPGLVDINTVIDYGQAQAAGTGMVLTANGTVLTNNHVIEGATSISVTDVGNGQTYQATVVGYSVTSDVAVLRLSGASRLQTVTTASPAPSIGEQVVGIGNAGGSGGTPSYAGGTVTATGQSITASDDLTGTDEQLTGMLETNADIQPGDSGGPLANDSGQVIGMDTAGSDSFQFTSQAQGTGYAIPIATATSIANHIVSGSSSSSVHVGPTAFLGIQVGQGNTGGPGDGSGGFGAPAGGVEISGVVSGGPAAAAGLVAGDVITSVAGYSTASQSALQQVLTADLSPGQTVTVQYTDGAGQQQSVALTLASGPPA